MIQSPYEPLTQLDYSNETVSSSLNSDAQNDRVNVDVDLVGSKAKALVRNKWEWRLRVATWNFSALCSDHKQKEIGELLVKHNLDVAVRSLGKKRKLVQMSKVTSGLGSLLSTKLE